MKIGDKKVFNGVVYEACATDSTGGCTGCCFLRERNDKTREYVDRCMLDGKVADVLGGCMVEDGENVCDLIFKVYSK